MYRGAAAADPFAFAHLLAAQEFAQRGPLSVMVAGERNAANALLQDLRRHYLPARVLALAADLPHATSRPDDTGQVSAHVCHRQTCSAPLSDPAELLARCLQMQDSG
ncbi:hypothetical protein D3C71_1700050 [compost metagenome]